jgi:lysophospholipase L1-like esterase
VITGQTGPNTTYLVTPSFLLGDDSQNPAIMGMGDSIEYGTGISGGAYGGYSSPMANWFDVGTPAGAYNTMNYSIPSTLITSIVNGSQLAWGRLAASEYADYVISDLGINDIPSSTWQQIAAAHLQVAQTFYVRGVRYVITTLTPRVSTTDAMTTVGNQTVSAYEGVRTGYNLWVRNGFQVNAGAPCNTANCGTASPYVYSFFDLAAAAGEVNVSGVPTNNGGFWPVPSSASFSCTVAGSPTTTSIPYTGCTLPLFGASSAGVLTWTVRDGGQACVISTYTSSTITCYAASNTTLTGIAVNGFATAPAAGDTITIYQTYSPDGIHPTYAEHQAIGAAFAAYAAATFVPFGAQQ